MLEKEQKAHHAGPFQGLVQQPGQPQSQRGKPQAGGDQAQNQQPMVSLHRLFGANGHASVATLAAQRPAGMPAAGTDSTFGAGLHAEVAAIAAGIRKEELGQKEAADKKIAQGDGQQCQPQHKLYEVAGREDPAPSPEYSGRKATHLHARPATEEVGVTAVHGRVDGGPIGWEIKPR